MNSKQAKIFAQAQIHTIAYKNPWFAAKKYTNKTTNEIWFDFYALCSRAPDLSKFVAIVHGNVRETVSIVCGIYWVSITRDSGEVKSRLKVQAFEIGSRQGRSEKRWNRVYSWDFLLSAGALRQETPQEQQQHDKRRSGTAKRFFFLHIRDEQADVLSQVVQSIRDRKCVFAICVHVTAHKSVRAIISTQNATCRDREL